MKELLESIPVPPKMYRHFAIVTVVVTGCMALFADAENREAIGNEIEQQQQQAALRQADAKLQTPVKYNPDRNRTSGGGFGSEGPVEPAGGDGAGASIGIRSGDGHEGISAVQSYDMGVVSPETLYMRQGKLPPPSTGPLFKKPPQPNVEDKAKLMRAAEERAGAPSQIS